MGDRGERSPARGGRAPLGSRPSAHAAGAPAFAPGMHADRALAPNRAPSAWGRGGAVRRAESHAAPLGSSPAPPVGTWGDGTRRPSMFDAFGRGDRTAAATAPPPPPMMPVVPTMGRTNSMPRPGFDVEPPPGMGRGRPSLLASVRERPSLLAQQRPPAVRVETQGSGVLGGAGTWASERESGELVSGGTGEVGGIGTPTPTSDATPKKRKLGGWGQALARAKTPTIANGTDAPSALRDEQMDEGEIRAGGLAREGSGAMSLADARAKAGTPTLSSGAGTPLVARSEMTPASDRGGWGAAAARAQATPATPKGAGDGAATPVDAETVAKARAAEQRLKVTKEALLSQMERVDGEVASLEKELEALKNSAEEEKAGVALDSKDEASRQRKETEALRQRLANAERSAQRAQDFAVSKMREASVLLRESSLKRAQRGAAAEMQRLNKEASAFAACAIQQMIERREARREKIQRDYERNKKLALSAIDRLKTQYHLPLDKDVKKVDFDAVVARCVAESKTPRALEVARQVSEILQKRRDAVAERNYTNALAYLKQREIWRVKMVQEANEKLNKEFVGGKKTFTPGARASGRNRSTNDLSGGVARSEYEEMQMIKALQRTEELRHMTKIPDMILDPHERRVAIFDSLNGLVEDPVAERDRLNLIRPWTKAEKKIFHEKFASYGKNFRRIAEHLEGRDTGDCVMYYYKFQKTDEGFRGRRRAAMKKKRAFADAQRMREIDPAKIEAQREERAAPTAEARLERAALAAAAKAAKAKARAEKAKAKAAKEAEEAKQNAGKPVVKGPDWTDMEKTKFVSGLLQYGKDFVAISSTIRTRSLEAVKQFYEDNRELMDLDSLIGES